MTKSDVIICRSRGFVWRTVTYCPTCKTRRRMTVMEAVWYGPRLTCCHCGDAWADGERLLRPAMRGWRIAAARRAKEEWKEAGTRLEAMEWLRREMENA